MQSVQPIPYQGSKRYIADLILRYFPESIDTLVEPFAGSAAVSIAAAIRKKASLFHLNDINEPLMVLWDDIINDPHGIADRYEKLWHDQNGREREFYYLVRDEFNRTHCTDLFLYLLVRCVKAAIRYNSNGDFNQSPDNRRKGRRPERMRADIVKVSRVFKGRITLSCKDYREILRSAGESDLVYMDPPYQGVCTGRDSRYYKSVSPDIFIGELAELSRRQISFIVSYDGRHGTKEYGPEIPRSVGVHRVEIAVGRSAQATLLGRNDITYESLYLSTALLDRLGLSPETMERTLATGKMRQLKLLE